MLQDDRKIALMQFMHVHKFDSARGVMPSVLFDEGAFTKEAVFVHHQRALFVIIESEGEDAW